MGTWWGLGTREVWVHRGSLGGLPLNYAPPPLVQAGAEWCRSSSNKVCSRSRSSSSGHRSDGDWGAGEGGCGQAGRSMVGGGLHTLSSPSP